MRSDIKNKRHFFVVLILAYFSLSAFILPVPVYAAENAGLGQNKSSQYNAVGSQMLHGHVPAAVARLQPVGRMSSSEHLHLAIGLPLRNQAMLTELLQRIYNPASPDYHHYLTPEQFTKMFGPTEQDYQAVIAFAKAHGLTVTDTPPNRMLLDVDGPVADIEKAMHVKMHVYQHPKENRTFYAPDVEPSLDLTVPILHISGLDNYALPRPCHIATPLAKVQNAAPNTGSGPLDTYMGNDFRSAYVPDSLLTGSGQIVGLLQFDGYFPADILNYEYLAELPDVPLSNVLIDGASGFPSLSGGEVEVCLDIEMAISMAPGLSEVIVYIAPNQAGEWENLLNRMANDNMAKQLSCSWYSPGGGPDPLAEQIFQQMAAQNQSFFCASGDSDAFTGPVGFPCDSPNITLVGGTTLTTSGPGNMLPGGKWVSETVWNNRDDGIGSGGGISTYYPIPSWQTNIDMTANQGSTTMRNIPDVALTAENVFVLADNAPFVVGGTSCAAPLWAGFTALVNQQRVAVGRPTIGFINPAVYSIGKGNNYSSCFHDITTGNNTSPSSPKKFYAVAGYDLCTGWGTPAGQNLINALTGYSLLCMNVIANVNAGDRVGPGREINYTIDYNYPVGPNCSDINDVNIIDYLPNELEFIASVPPPDQIIDSNKIIWNIGTLHLGDSGSVTLEVKVKCAEPNSTITNECNIISSGLTLNTAHENTPVGCPTLTNVDNITGYVSRGDDITYNVCYAANGYSDTGVLIADTLPTGVEFLSATGNYNYVPGTGTITWNIGTMRSIDTNCFTVTVHVKCAMPGSTITNSCQMSGDCISPIIAEDNTSVCSTYALPTLTKVDNITGCVKLYDDVNYTICYTANGYGDTNVVITDYLPKEMNYISSNPAGTYHHYSDANTVTWSINFPSDACGCITLTTQVNNNVMRNGTITNSCELKGDCVDINMYQTNSVCSCLGPIYVDASAAGGNNGYSWADAYNHLQDALQAAKDYNCNEILVAQGIYRPDINSAHPNGTSDRETTFQLINGVAVYGGFPAGGGTMEDRKPSVYETILSGDLLQNDRPVAEPCDLLNDPCRADNSYHVVTGSGVTQTAILDGFTIAGGDANAGSPYNSGGGMYNNNGNPTVRCTFIRNAAQSGGGIYLNSNDSNATITNCTFIENSASGGYYDGYYNSGYGGGIYCRGSWDSSIAISNCLFNNNWADQGGGIYIMNGGGGVSYVTNCTSVANSADSGGSAIYGTGYGGVIGVTVTNCILWGNVGEQISGAIDANVTYSDIQGGWEGVGNIQDYPMFATDGYHLKMCSPCVDAGTNTPASGLPATDIDGEDRIMNGECTGGAAIVDMGADEYLPDCNAMLYAHCRKPACNDIAALYVGEVPDVNLEWSPGRLAASHDVYFGTDYSGVYNATTATLIIYKGRQSATSYLATGLSAGNTYYWRIDEVNNTNIWQGPVYSFRTGLFIDDFERYSDTNDINANWTTGYTTCTAEVEGGVNTGGRLTYVIDADGKHMNFYYNNYIPGGGTPFSEANYPYSGGTVFSNGKEPNMLVISFKGAIGNIANPIYDRMYVAIEDTAGKIGVKYNPDPNAAKVTTWTQWYIPLNDPNFAPVNLTKVSNFYLGFGQRCVESQSAGRDGNVMFDNIQLEPPYTPQGRQLTADFTCDCIVNFADLAIMGQEWHTKGIKANIYPIGNPDNIVDIMDLAELAEEWLR
ncbi:MAG: protease pro-enzyme activation domain-containing protein [Sedimentisphaerales bacterium]|jgi:hypothetical protein